MLHVRELVRELAVRSSSTGAWYSQFVEANLSELVQCSIDFYLTHKLQWAPPR